MYAPIRYFIFIVLLKITLNLKTFSSISYLNDICDQERICCALLSYWIKDNENNIQVRQLTRFLSFTTNELDAVNISPSYFENPINVFHTLRRFQSWKDVTIIMQPLGKDAQPPCSLNTSDLQHIDEQTDLAALSLAKLVHVYQLSIKDFINGKILTTQTQKLTIDEIIYIADVSVQKQLFNIAIIWYSAAWQESINYTASRYIFTAIAYSSLMQQVNLFQDAHTILSEAINRFPYSQHLRQRAEILPGEVSFKGVCYKENHYLEEESFGHNYAELCRGEKVSEMRSLKCYYKFISNGFILPVKEEVIMEDPIISIYHDTITTAEADYLLSISLKKLEAAKVIFVKKGTKVQRYAYETRIADMTSWNDSDPIVWKLSHRIQLITRLSTTLKAERSDAEYLQVTKYGVGGFFEPHHDSFPIRNQRNTRRYLADSGNRIATFIFYLNNVNSGGATVFPHLDVTVFPQKGSAIFWYDLKQNGDRDDRLLHAGCPVLLGQKSIATKWIWDYGQMFIRKCNLDKNV